MSAPFPARTRFSICLPRPLGAGVAAIVLTLTAHLAARPADDDFDEDAPMPVVQPAVPVTNVFGFVFGEGCDAGLARGQLDTLLLKKIAAMHVVCDLTEEQTRKLLTAGRGDIKRLIDRVDEIGTRLKLVGPEKARDKGLIAELNAIKRGLTSEFASTGSLFDKVLKRNLTAEQNARIVTLQEVEQAGAQVYAEAIGPNAILEISLSGVLFADESLARLKVLTGLQGLNLTSTPVTDAGLVHLQGLTNLRALDLTGTKVTDAGLASLNRMQALRRLELFNTQVTSAGLAHLTILTDLRELNLSDTQVADAGLAHVKELKKLQSLNLHKTHVTDAGLAHLTDLTSLEWLDVSGTQVSDAGLVHLKGLRNLQWVNLSSTRTTDAGLAGLKRALPTANIWKRRVRDQD
ncbi:MAG: hypothetical protein HY290_26585 [Planctomycetia bacterium]|nr:hypothetical protein [Planctomycetia bacterium]